MRALLDVNVLIVLLDENHIHHAAASDWLAERIESGWASCPLTLPALIAPENEYRSYERDRAPYRGD